jgi:hypothetical protein
MRQECRKKMPWHVMTVLEVFKSQMLSISELMYD